MAGQASNAPSGLRIVLTLFSDKSHTSASHTSRETLRADNGDAATGHRPT